MVSTPKRTRRFDTLGILFDREAANLAASVHSGYYGRWEWCVREGGTGAARVVEASGCRSARCFFDPAQCAPWPKCGRIRTGLSSSSADRSQCLQQTRCTRFFDVARMRADHVDLARASGLRSSAADTDAGRLGHGAVAGS